MILQVLVYLEVVVVMTVMPAVVRGPLARAVMEHLAAKPRTKSKPQQTPPSR